MLFIGNNLISVTYFSIYVILSEEYCNRGNNLGANQVNTNAYAKWNKLMTPFAANYYRLLFSFAHVGKLEQCVPQICK